MGGNDPLVTIYNDPFLISSCWMGYICQSGKQLLQPSSYSISFFLPLFSLSLCLSVSLSLSLHLFIIIWLVFVWRGQRFVVVSFMTGLPLLCSVGFYVATRGGIFMWPSLFFFGIITSINPEAAAAARAFLFFPIPHIGAIIANNKNNTHATLLFHDEFPKNPLECLCLIGCGINTQHKHEFQLSKFIDVSSKSKNLVILLPLLL